MEEALQQLVTDSLDLSKRKISGPAGSITVTMDTRALAPDHRIFYRNLHKFRVSQMNEGVDLTDLSDEQWGMVQLDKCHHISTTSTSKDGPQSFRVRICKTCCQEDSHIELGTYVDQESAILVNDTFEILNERLERLIVLRVEDKPDLHYLVAKKYDRSKGRDYACILDLISERIAAIEGKKRKPSATDIIPAFAKRAGEVGSTSSNSGSTDNGNTPHSSCSTSSEASDEQRTRSTPALKGGGGASNSGSHSSLQSALSAPNSRHNSARKNRDGIVRRISISTPGDEEESSNNGSASAADDDITVTEESGLALRELSSVCYQRLLSPSLVGTIPGSADLAVGSLVTGTSMFDSSVSTADLVRSLEKARSPSSLSSGVGSAIKGPLIYSTDRPIIGSPFSGSNDSRILCESPTSSSTAVNNFSGMSSAASETTEHHSSSKVHHSESAGNLSAGGSHHKRSRQVQDDAADIVHSYRNNERLAGLDGQTPRKRAATFSVSEPYPYYSAVDQNPIATLTWLASMEDDEVDVARSLYELRGNTAADGASVFDTRGSGASGAPSAGVGGSTGGALGLALGLGLGSSGLDARFSSASYVPYRNFGNQDFNDGYYQNQDEEDGEEDEEDDDELDVEEYYNSIGKSYNYGGAFEHNGKLYSHSMGYGNIQGGAATGGNISGTYNRVRSSSMSMIDRSEAAWAILGSTGGYRSKMDPLSMALKKYHERGGSANAAASGFVGIYSPEDRKSRIMRFLEKRKRRMWTKKVKYDVRKNFADSRVRVKGRFVKKQEEDGEGALNTSHISTGSFDSDALNHSYSSQHLADDDGEYPDEEDGGGGHSSVSRSRDSTVGTPRGSGALNLKLKLTKAVGGSGKKRTEAKAEVVKSEAAKNDLKLTISSRRRRNSSVGDIEDVSATVTPSESSAKSQKNISPSSTVALKLEKATLSSAVKAAPVY